MRVKFDEWAKREFDDARAWYAGIHGDLARRFAAEVRDAGRRVVRQPLMYPIESGDIRKCVLTQFPYTLRYAVRSDLILIVAVSHQHRNPDYWVSRTSKQ